MRKSSTAFTLVEVMMVIALSVLILTPAYQIFKSGSQTSIQGMQQIEMVLEARRILRQIHNDLKMGCLELPAQAFSLNFNAMVDTKILSQNSLAGSSWSFLTFPMHGEVQDAVNAQEKNGKAPRLASRITYRLEPSSKLPTPFMKLIRKELGHAKLGTAAPEERVLSERVNFFSIKPVEIQTTVGKNQWVFNVNIQLVEVRQPQALTNPQAGKVITNRSNGLLIADFFDVVYPEFFASLWNQEFMGRNWYTSVQGPIQAGP